MAQPENPPFEIDVEQLKAWLDQGFERVTNLTGGIEAWSLRVDPSVPRY